MTVKAPIYSISRLRFGTDGKGITSPVAFIGQGWLVPANPEYPKIRISPDDDFSVWGTVTYIIHKARD